MIRAILACDDAWGIGKNGDLPWPKNSDDLKWFKECTADSVVVMGRKTWESLPRKPLPGRENIVISSGVVEGVDISISGDPIQALGYIKEMFDDKNIWVIGGAQLLEAVLPYCDEIHLSRIEGKYDCDTFLPYALITTTFKMCTSTWKNSVYVEIWKKL